MGTYNRFKAVQYADTFWRYSNPSFLTFSVDCTNFVSQCLYAGGLPMDYTRKRDTGWWYIGLQQNQELWSYSWAVAHSLQMYLIQSLRAIFVPDASQLELGDVISYDWDGDGRYQHSAIVTAFDENHKPFVNAHTYNTYHHYWDYFDSPAWLPLTQYRFIHILDSF